MLELITTFTVLGEPAPQGSKTRTRFGVRDDNPRTKPWRQEVTGTAINVMDGMEPFRGEPIVLKVDCFFSRPLGHYGSGRNAGVLKASAPEHKLTKPDTLKLGRAVEDSLSGVIYGDDSQVVDVQARKYFGDPPRAEVTVYRIVSDTHSPSSERIVP